MEVIDKGLDPNNPKECIMELVMTPDEAAQMDILLQRTGLTIDQWVEKMLRYAVENPEGLAALAERHAKTKNMEKKEG